ncbi:hypothetical protein ACQPU1_00965 [Clostridium paraputrificum]|uniref:hypothetical protein n=1 Tax=Clostridium TaxID=1485 RepID=UPI003D3393CE
MKYRKKSGYTLIECIVYMATSLIIVTLGIKLLFQVRSSYIKDIKNSMEINVVEEGFQLVDSMNNSEVTDIYYENNKIVFFKDNAGDAWESTKVWINGDNLVADYYDASSPINSKVSNVILRGVKGSQIIKKGRIIYLVIMRGEERFIKCI